jgi:hypothetical protein
MLKSQKKVLAPQTLFALNHFLCKNKKPSFYGGFFILPKNKDKKIVFIAGGIGITHYPDDWRGERGFIDEKMIRRIVPDVLHLTNTKYF